MLIGELARRTGRTVKTIRYYETIGLLPIAPRSEGGYRMYGSQDEQRLDFIRAAQSLGLRLDDVREIMAFRERGEMPCQYVRGRLRDESRRLSQKIKAMIRLQGELERLSAKAELLPPDPGDPCLCHIIRPQEADEVRPREVGEQA